MKPQTIVKITMFVVLLLLVVLVQLVKSIEVDHYRGVVSAWVEQKTGRQVSFAGPLTLKFGFRPALVTDGVRLANRAGAPSPDMVRLDHVEAEIGLLPLLSGEVRVNRLSIDGADILLQSDGQGHGNWSFSAPISTANHPAGGAPATALRLTQVILDHAVIHVEDGDSHVMSIDHATLDTDGVAAPVALTLGGQWDAKHLSVNGFLGSVRDMTAADKPFPVQLKMLMPGLVASLDGSFRDDAKTGVTLDLAVAVDISERVDFGSWIGLPLPAIGPARVALALTGGIDHPRVTGLEATIGRHDSLAFTIKGRIDDPLAGNGVDLALLIDGDAAALFSLSGPAEALPLAVSGHVTSNGVTDSRFWQIADLKGTLGHSDIAGQITLRRDHDHGVIEGRVDSAVIDLARPFLAAPGAGDPPRASASLTPLGGDRYFFSDAKLPFEIFADSQGKFTWAVGHLSDGDFDASALTLEVAWRERKLQLEFKVGSLAGGSGEGHLVLDGAVAPALLSIDLSLSRVIIGGLLSSLGWSDAIEGGRLDYRFKANGTGDSPRALVATLQGSSLLSVGQAQIGNRLAGQGLGVILSDLAPGPSGDKTELRCLISHFALIDGLARSEALMFTLGGIAVTGQGSINLGSETLDFTLTPRPVAPNAATPLDIGGSLLHPLVSANRGAIVKNLPVATGGAESPLLGLAGTDGNPCFATLLQGKKPRQAGAGMR
jgi:hypothetical protein